MFKLKRIIEVFLIVALLLMCASGYAQQFPGAPTIPNKNIQHNDKLERIEGSKKRNSIPFSDYILDNSGVYAYRHVELDSIIKYKLGSSYHVLAAMSDTLSIKPNCGNIAIRVIDSCTTNMYIYSCTRGGLTNTLNGWKLAGSFFNKNCSSGSGGGGSSGDVRWGGFTAVNDSIRLDSIDAAGVLLGSKYLDNVINDTEIDYRYFYTVVNDSLRILTEQWNNTTKTYDQTGNQYINNVINKKVDFQKVNDSTYVHYSSDFGNDTIIVPLPTAGYYENWYTNDGHVLDDRIAYGDGFNTTWRNMNTMRYDSLVQYYIRSKIGVSAIYSDFNLQAASFDLSMFNNNGYTSTNGGRLNRVQLTPTTAVLQSIPNGASPTGYSTNEFRASEIAASIKTRRLETDGTMSYADSEYPASLKRIRQGTFLMGFNFQGSGETKDNTSGKLVYSPYRMPVTMFSDTGQVLVSSGDSLRWMPMGAYGGGGGGGGNWYNSDGTLTGNRLAKGGGFSATWQKYSSVTFDSVVGLFRIIPVINANTAGNFTFSYNNTIMNHSNNTTGVLYGYNTTTSTGGGAYLRAGKSGITRESGIDTASAFIKTPTRLPDGTFDYGGNTIPERRLLQSSILGTSGTYSSTGGRLAYTAYGFPAKAAPDSNYVLVSKNDTLAWKSLNETADTRRSVTINLLGFTEGFPIVAGYNFETFFLVPADMNGWNIVGWEVSLGQQKGNFGSMIFDIMKVSAASNPGLPVALSKEITVSNISNRYVPYPSSFSQPVLAGDIIMVRYVNNPSLSGSPKGLCAKFTFVKP